MPVCEKVASDFIERKHFHPQDSTSLMFKILKHKWTALQAYCRAWGQERFRTLTYFLSLFISIAMPSHL